jgi:hypothetical protein
MLSLLVAFSTSRGDLSDATSPALTSRLRHFECYNIVRIIDHNKKAGNADSYSVDYLSTHCARLQDFRRNICQTLVPSRFANISAQLAEKRRPHQICDSLGFARSAAAGSCVVSRDQCARFADKAKRETESGKAKLPKPFSRKTFYSKACKDVAPEERTNCFLVSRLVTKSDIKKEMSGAEICDYLEAKKFIKFEANAAAGKGAGPEVRP